MSRLAGIPDEQIELRIINRGRRLARLLELGAPAIIVVNEKALLDEAYQEWASRRAREGLSIEPMFDGK